MESLLVEVRVNYLLTLISFLTFVVCLPQYVTTILEKPSISDLTLIRNKARSPLSPVSGIITLENQQFVTHSSPVNHLPLNHPTVLHHLNHNKTTLYTTKITQRSMILESFDCCSFSKPSCHLLS